jgi:hypothetical protein
MLQVCLFVFKYSQVRYVVLCVVMGPTSSLSVASSLKLAPVKESFSSGVSSLWGTRARLS